MKQTVYDRNSFKLIERVSELRKLHPGIIVGKIQRPLIVGGIADGVFELEVEF